MNKSDSIKELATALALAQAEMPKVAFNSVNPFLKNKYADLGGVIETSRPVLARHGLSVSQLTTSDGELVGVTTILMHSSGEWIESTVALPAGDEKGKSLAQVAGSIITYLRRYSLASILGMYADEDTDGNGSNHAQQRQERATEQTTQAQPAQPANSKPKMSLETARAVTSSDGTLYGDIPSEKLGFMSATISKQLKKSDLTVEQREEYQYKLDAIAVILASR